jgi:hypothetical protein
MPVKKDAKTRTSVTDLDLFGAAPGFNIGGKKRVGSICGFIVTLLIVCVMLIYGVPKLINVITKADIKVSNQVLNAIFNEFTLFNVKENNFMFAFGVQDLNDGSNKDDENYIKWYAYVEISVSQKWYERHFTVHRCTQEDFRNFYPPS